MELCDWLLVKDDVSKLTGDIGGVGLLHSECEREPGESAEKGASSASMCTSAALVIGGCTLQSPVVPLCDPVARG